MRRVVCGVLSLAGAALIASGCGAGDPTPPPPPPAADLPDFVSGSLDLPSPDWLAAGAGAIWVKLDSGRILRIDPRSMEIVATIERADASEDFDLCQGIAFAGDAVWSCAGPDVVRIDPSTDVATILPIRKVRDQGSIPFAGGKVWFLDGDADRLVGVDPLTLEADVTIELGSPCSDVDGVADMLWVACERDDVVRRVDIARGEVGDEVTLDGASMLAVSADRVWVAASAGIVAIDPTSMTVGDPVAKPGTVHRIRVGPSGVWVRAGAPYLTLIDPLGSVVGVWASAALDPGDVLELDGAVWLTNAEEGILTRAGLLGGG